jgi:hypothetical protein
MSCKNDPNKQNERPESTEKDEVTESTRQGMGFDCPCGECPPKAKWICLAGLAGVLGLVALRVLRQPAPAPCGAR